MLKKCLMMLLTLALLLPYAALAEQGEVWVCDARLDQRGDGSVLLHLLLAKDGAAVQLDDVGVVFLNEAGETVQMTSVALHAAPIMALPEGEHFFPVTLAAVPAKGATVADFRITGLYTSRPDGPLPQTTTGMPGYFLMQGPECDELTAYTDAFAGTEAFDYVGFSFVYDREGRYMGNVILPRGSASFVAGERLLPELAAVLRWEERMLLDAGFPGENPDSILFARVPMSDLPQGVTPGSAYTCIYAIPQQETWTLRIVGFTLEAEAGRFTIHALAQNATDSHVRLEDVPYVAMYDAAGNVRLCREVTMEAPFRVAEPGGITPFILTGALEEGFVPEGCGFETVCEPVDGPDHVPLTSLSAAEAGGAQDCIALLVCTDAKSGSLIGLAWTQPGEAEVVDGQLVFPELPLMQSAPDGAALVETFFRLLPRE